MTAVEDERKITHAVGIAADTTSAGITTCGTPFVTVSIVVRLKPEFPYLWRPEHMNASEAEVTCMACIAQFPAYDEA